MQSFSYRFLLNQVHFRFCFFILAKHLSSEILPAMIASKSVKVFGFRNMKIALTAIPSRKQSSQSNEMVLVDVSDKTGIATVTMNKLPANSLNPDFLTSMNEVLDQLISNNTRGMILTSVS
jgi:hypothetical protein